MAYICHHIVLQQEKEKIFSNSNRMYMHKIVNDVYYLTNYPFLCSTYLKCILNSHKVVLNHVLNTHKILIKYYITILWLNKKKIVYIISYSNCSPCWPGTSSSLLNVSALNPLSQGEYYFRFPGSFWNPRINAARSSTCRIKLLSFLLSNSLTPLGPSSFSTSLANFYNREKDKKT